MESTEQQQQSSSNIDNIDSNMDKELPFVDALVTPAPGTNLRGTLTHVATLQKLQEKEREIKQHLKHIQELEWTINIQEIHKQNLITERTISRLPSSPPATSEQLGHAPSSLLPAQEAEIMQDEQALQLLMQSIALKKHAYICTYNTNRHSHLSIGFRQKLQARIDFSIALNVLKIWPIANNKEINKWPNKIQPCNNLPPLKMI
jgi:hypothetical protein